MPRAFVSLISILAATGVAAAPASAATRPDLTVKALTAPARLTIGVPTTIKLSVATHGATKATRTLLLLSTDRRRDKADVALNGKGTATAKAKRTGTIRVSARVTVPAGTRAGSYALIVCADAGAAVKERSEKNNCRVASGSVAVAAAGTAAPAPTPAAGTTPPAPATPTVTTPAAPPAPLDTTPPAAPTVDATTPVSPAPNPSPFVQVTGEPAARVDIFTAAACAGAVAASITLPSGGVAGLPVPVPHNTTSILSAKAVDAAGNASPCSSVTKSYRHDDIPPADPVVSLSSPYLGGTVATATYTGTAEAGSTVTAYDFSTDCFGTPDVTTSPASFAFPGISLNAFFGEAAFKATDAAGNASACVLPPTTGTYAQVLGSAQSEGSGDNATRTGTGVVVLDVNDQRDQDPGVVDGTVSAPGDVDYYRVDLPYSGYSLVVDLRSSDSVNCASGTDTKLTLENAAGTALAVNDDYTTAHLCSRLDNVSTPLRTPGNRDLPAGTYYLRVEAFSGAPFGYRLVARPFFTGDFETSNNDTVAGATPVTGPHASMLGNVSPTTDLDYYKVTAPSSGQLTVDVLPGQGNGAPACGGAGGMDSYVDVLSADGGTILGSNDDIGSGDYCSHLVKTGLTAGTTYLIRVKRAPVAFSGAATTFPYVLTVGP